MDWIYIYINTVCIYIYISIDRLDTRLFSLHFWWLNKQLSLQVADAKVSELDGFQDAFHTDEANQDFVGNVGPHGFLMIFDCFDLLIYMFGV